MKQNKTTKRAVLTSALSLLLCCTMLIGTTWAWFTDSVTSAGNIIKSGTLDVEMKWAEGDEDPATTTTWTDASTGAIFNNELWEPGYVDVKHVKIANVGTLALKYQIVIKANGELEENANGHTLADAIDVYYLENAAQVADRDAFNTLAANATPIKLSDFLTANANVATNTATGKLYPIGNKDNLPDNHTVTIALKMREDAGNEYQDMAIGTDFSVQLLATQWTYEEDTFDDQYDKDAEYPAPILGVFANVDNQNGISFNVNNAPVTEKATNVAITGLDDVAEGDKLALNVEAADLEAAAANTAFTVSDGETAVAGLDLTLVDLDNQKVTFDGGTATVTTYIVPGLNQANISVKYNGEGANGAVVSYNAETGELVFTTTHFSQFYVVYNGSMTYVPQLSRAFVGNDPASSALDAIAEYAETFVTNLDKIDSAALLEAADPMNLHGAYEVLLIGGCNGMRPAYVNSDILDFADVTSEEALIMQQQYFDAYAACVNSVKFFPIGEGVYAWSPWPIGMSFGVW